MFDRMRGNGLKFHQGRLRLDIRKKIVKGCSGIGTDSPGKLWNQHSWKCSKAMWMWQQGTGTGFSGEVATGLNDLRGFSTLSDSLIL